MGSWGYINSGQRIGPFATCCEVTSTSRRGAKLAEKLTLDALCKLGASAGDVIGCCIFVGWQRACVN
jgi:hypothetical protein